MGIKKEERFLGLLGWTTQMIFKICWKVDNQPLSVSEYGINTIQEVLFESLTR